MQDFNRNTSGIDIVKAFPDQIAGNVIAITGPSVKSLGAEAAYSLAQSTQPPAHLILLGRNATKVQPVIDRIHALNATIKTTFIPLDLSSNATVRSAAASLRTAAPKLDILINSAGIMALEHYTQSADGFEMQLAANHIGHFLLTLLTLPSLLAASTTSLTPPRIVTLTSTGYEAATAGFNIADPNFSSGATYDRWLAYAQAKTANILFTRELARRVPQVTALVLHPGVVLESGIAQNTSMADLTAAFEAMKQATEAAGGEFAPEELKTMQQGCGTTCFAAIAPGLEGKSGAFLWDCAVVPDQVVKPWARDELMAKRLWEVSEGWVGETLSL